MAQETINQATCTPAAAAISTNVFVKPSASGFVECDTAGELAVGVILEESPADSTRSVPMALVASGGLCEVKAGGTIAAGNPVATANDGEAVAATSGTTTRILGIAAESAVAGDIFEVYLGHAGFAAQ